jgi:hypothetical protein
MLAAAAGLAAASYLITLAASAPARSLPLFRDGGEAVTDAAGTVWNGSARLTGGQTLTWRFRPGASLSAAGLAWSARLDGPDTALTARISARPGRLGVDAVEGVAGWSLLALTGAAGPAECALAARVASGRAAVTRHAIIAEGSASAPSSACRGPGGERFDLPALRAEAETRGDGARIVVKRAEDGQERLAELVLGPQGSVEMVLTREGAQVFRTPP